MSAIYPRTWSSSFRSEKQLQLSMAEWGRELIKLDPQQIAHGLERTKQRPGDFPPSLPEFLTLCNGHTGLTHNTAAYDLLDRSKALEKKADPEKARIQKQRIDEILKPRQAIRDSKL